jgi:hypothetical protein
MFSMEQCAFFKDCAFWYVTWCIKLPMLRRQLLPLQKEPICQILHYTSEEIPLIYHGCERIKSTSNMLTFILLMWRIGWALNSIPIYSYIQQDATSHNLFITENCSTCFGWYFHSKHGEQFPDINKLCNVTSCWIYIGIYLQCMDP